MKTIAFVMSLVTLGSSVSGNCEELCESAAFRVENDVYIYLEGHYYHVEEMTHCSFCQCKMPWPKD